MGSMMQPRMRLFTLVAVWLAAPLAGSSPAHANLCPSQHTDHAAGWPQWQRWHTLTWAAIKEQQRQRHLPVPGALYSCTMTMPVIGRQTFMLHVLTRSRARITLQGRLNLDEP